MTDCPSTETLAAFTHGGPDPDAAAEIAEHVLSCPTCMCLVDSELDHEQEAPDGPTPDYDAATIDRDAQQLVTGAHMTPTLLAAYLEQRLTTLSEDLVMEHLATCTECGDAMLYLMDGGRSWKDFVQRYGETLGFSAGSETEGCASE